MIIEKVEGNESYCSPWTKTDRTTTMNSSRNIITVPPNPTELDVWTKKIKIKVKKELLLKANLEQYYVIILGQCIKSLIQVLKEKQEL